MDFGDMMKNVREMAGRANEMQGKLREKVCEGSAGGGMVTVRMNGAGDLVGLDIEKDVIDPEDPEMLSDLILAAVSAAKKKVEEMRVESMSELTGGIDPSSLGIDLGNLM